MAPLRKLLSLAAIVVLVLVTGWLFFNYKDVFNDVPVNADGTSSGGGNAYSIVELAYQYTGMLSRKLFPDFSLFLPLWLQLMISYGLILVMAVTALFFPRARRFAMFITVIACLRHLLWRGFETLDMTSISASAISVTIYVAEIMSFFAMILGYFQIWGQTQHQSVGLSRYSDEQLPSVDVMVCTYSEPVSVLYRSLVGAMSMEYPKKNVYLLDDGNRAEMRELAAKVGAHYIARTENKHAKAGNLNNAMAQTQGDLVLVFDADHVACKQFLQEVVGFFMVDTDLGFVQTPQHFFTEDPFQRNLVASKQINNEQDLFFHVIEPGNDYWGAAFFGGSGAIFRRKAISDVGGFAIETITEDVHTGMRIHAKGWKSLFYNKDLAAGMAQESFADFIKQRLRWSKGMTQIFMLENPLFKAGLTLAQKYCYLAGIWYFFHGLPRLIFLIAPLFFLLLGYKTVNAGFIEVLIYYVPSFLCAIWGYTIITNRVRHAFWSEVYEAAFCVYTFFTTSLTMLSPKRAKFMVTPKGGISEEINFNWRIVFPQMAIAALTIVGIVMAVIRATYTPEYGGGIYTNLFWSIYNLVLLLGAIYVAQERPQYRLAPRIFRRIRCELKLLDGSIAVGYTTNVSESGMAVVFNEPVPVSGTVQLKLMDWEINETTIVTVQAIRSSLNQYNQHYVGFKIVNRTEEQHQKMVRHMFGSPDVWKDDYVFHDTGVSFWNLITSPFRVIGYAEKPLKRGAPRFQVTLSCVLLVDGHSIMGFSDDVSETGMSVLVNKNEPVRLGQDATSRIQWPSGEVTDMTCKVARLEDAGSGQHRVGLTFVNLTREQRIALINNIYRPKEGLIRVAPSVNKLVRCTIKTPQGHQVTGTSHEISEMGLIALLAPDAKVNPGDPCEVAIEWPGAEGASVKTYRARVMDAQDHGNALMTLLYFEGLDMKTLDDISLRIHEPEQSEAFHTLASKTS